MNGNTDSVLDCLFDIFPMGFEMFFFKKKVISIGNICLEIETGDATIRILNGLCKSRKRLFFYFLFFLNN